jgi:hypothetical protein
MSSGSTSSRPGAHRSIVGAVVLALAAAVLPAVALLPASHAVVAAPEAALAPAALPAPVSRTFTAAIDAEPEYQGQATCSPSAKPGAAKLAALLNATYGTYSIGISRSCAQGGQSEHKEGRALDWMVSIRVPAQKARAEAFLTWLLATDQWGNAAAMARRLGVMYIGWNNRFWRGYDIATGWTELRGCLTEPAKAATSYDTYCHRNHVHLSLTWEGALAMTSFWSGVPLAAACQPEWAPAQAAPARGGDLVLIPPVRVLDTVTGRGLASPCRLGAPRWAGDRRGIVVSVVGQGGVPATGVAAVAVRVNSYRGSAPSATVALRSTDTTAAIPAVTTLSSGGYPATAVIPVAPDGTIRLTLDKGTVDVQMEVVGWVPAAVVTPPAAATTDGQTHVVAPATVFDATSAPLAPGESRVVTLAGKGGIPASGFTGLALTVGVDRTASPDAIGVMTGRFVSYVGNVSSSRLSPRTTTVIAPTTDGRVLLRNRGSSPAVVRVRVLAWFGDVPTAGGGSLHTGSVPVRVIDTFSGLGLAGAATTSTARTVRITGGPAAPAGSTAVLVSVSSYGGTQDGLVQLGSRWTIDGLNVNRAQWAHEVVVLPLLPSGLISVRLPVGGHLRMSVLGYVD